MKDRRVAIGQAKAHFANLVRGAERGVTVILTRHGRPVARLCPVAPAPGAEVAEGPAIYDSEPPGRSLGAEARRAAMERLLANEVWSRIPADQLGKAPDRAERETILGYDEGGA